jgi:hypothetical protein
MEALDTRILRLLRTSTTEEEKERYYTEETKLPVAKNTLSITLLRLHRYRSERMMDLNAVQSGWQERIWWGRSTCPWGSELNRVVLR